MPPEGYDCADCNQDRLCEYALEAATRLRAALLVRETEQYLREVAR